MLKGLSALVTGGASGLGRATVERLSRGGCKVVLCDLPTSEGSKVAGGLSGVTFAPTDVSVDKDVQDAVDICRDKYGKLDVVVNCAGIAIAKRILDRTNQPHSIEDFQKVMKVNVMGTFNVIRLAAVLMAENTPNEDNGRGVIINTASIAAFEGQMGQSAYSASKGAIVSMTLPIARDLGPVGIRVVTIAPGLFETPLMDQLPEKVRLTLERFTCFPRRFGKVDEFAHLAEHIILNQMLNGCVIRLDGGMRMPS